MIAKLYENNNPGKCRFRLKHIIQGSFAQIPAPRLSLDEMAFAGRSARLPLNDSVADLKRLSLKIMTEKYELKHIYEHETVLQAVKEKYTPSSDSRMSCAGIHG